MTQTIAVNNNNDIYIGADGNLAFFTGLQATLQCCEHAAKTILGELVLQTDEGLPYFQAVWVGAPNIAQFENALINAVQAVSGVQNVLSVNISSINNTLLYDLTILTIYGQGVINGEV